MVKTFYDYMLQFLEEESPRGDLARDMHHEQERSLFRTCDLNGIRTWDQMDIHLSDHQACSGCRETAKACWRDFQKNRDSA